jgi:hypothetical protein
MPSFSLKVRKEVNRHSTKFQDVVAPYLNQDWVVSEVSYNRTKSAIHTSAVSSYIASAGFNEVLGVVPPPIYPSEESLQRPYRRILAQLRSGKCACLRTFQSFINQANDNLCPAALLLNTPPITFSPVLHFQPH